MKWFFFSAAACVSVLLPHLLKQRQSQIMLWTAIGLLPFLIEPLHLYMAMRSWAMWPGYVKGLEVTLLDLLALGLYFALPARKAMLPFKTPMALYGTTVALSCFQSDTMEISFGYLFQLARMFLLYALIAKASSDENISNAIFNGLAIGICIQSAVVFGQRYILGELQTTGTFVHQNSLGISAHFVALPFFALFLYKKAKWLSAPLVVSLAYISIAMLTVSRATIGLAALGLTFLFTLSIFIRWSSRKATIGIAGLVAVLFLLPAALTSFEARSNISAEGRYDERAAFEAAASAIIASHPWGIGPNNYVIVANSQGYNDRAGVIPTPNSLSANVHNIYYLIAAETGWIGLITYVLMMFAPLLYAIKHGYRLRVRSQGQLLLGLATSLLIVMLHSLYEWALISWSLQYFVAISFGLIVGLSRQDKEASIYSSDVPQAFRARN